MLSTKMLSTLTAHLRKTLGIRYKQDIQTASSQLPTSSIPLGDDCAAIPDGNGYLLLAAEGILPQFVESDPWFAGWCAVMVNVSDIYAMGGRPIALVDTLWSQTPEATQPIWQGMLSAAQTYNVPIVGGHTHCQSPYNALSMAILGRAASLITSFNAREGDCLMVVADFRGQAHPRYPFWDAATHSDPAQLRADLELLPKLAEIGLCDAGKDISMGGILGTLLMLLETSRCGAILYLDRIPSPTALPLEDWLTRFPSYGFLLSVRSENMSAIQFYFRQRHLVCEWVGTVHAEPQLVLSFLDQTEVFWDFDQQPLTGFAPLQP
jgi:uncharacterized protein